MVKKTTSDTTPIPSEDNDIVNKFNGLYYKYSNFAHRWLGIEIMKAPTDLWIYHEIIQEQKPDLIIETGTYKGGSALFLACICDILNHGEVITIDTEKLINPPAHQRIKYLTGSSIDKSIISTLDNIAQDKNVLVILDSDHTPKHVYTELNLYSKYIPIGGYLICEDTITVDVRKGLTSFLKHNSDFVSDPSREKFLQSYNPTGYLQRIK